MEIIPHQFGVIGLKKLSTADKGLSEKSNQTHIGLFENTLYCIDDLHLIDYCTLVINKTNKKTLCLLDYIENPDGSFRSPKIRKGHAHEIIVDGITVGSVVRDIRDYIFKTDQIKDWYLLWFVTNEDQIIFVLFEFRSVFFDMLSSNLNGLSTRHEFKPNTIAYSRVIKCLKSIIDINDETYRC